MKLLGWCALAVLACSTAPARAQQRVTVSDARTLLLAAIESPDGKAQGVLVGEEAQAITQRFQGKTPIQVEVTTLRRYAQPGCSRLNVRIWQEGVLLPGASSPRRQTIDIGINYCRDGQPPRSLD